jgi:hypothetical protein
VECLPRRHKWTIIAMPKKIVHDVLNVPQRRRRRRVVGMFGFTLKGARGVLEGRAAIMKNWAEVSRCANAQSVGGRRGERLHAGWKLWPSPNQIVKRSHLRFRASLNGEKS